MIKIEASDLERIFHFPLFDGISKDQILRLLENSLVKTLKHREYLFRAGDDAGSFSLVLEGAVKLIRHSPKGEDIIMHFALQGDLVGALVMSQVGPSIFPISAKSMGPTRLINIPRATYNAYWQSHLTIQKKINAILYRRMNLIQDDKTMSTSPLRVRIANLLMRHVDNVCAPGDQQLTIKLTRQEIADSLGVAVESVIRIMSEWQANGTIKKSPIKGLEKIDIDKLHANLEF
ncbi:MAG: Crp/Fnr family transcriptional regulator [Oligoflexia bacterium]|nr:Crp/Fnr family transcriptional regulator [Oligoflexia bacterium]